MKNLKINSVKWHNNDTTFIHSIHISKHIDWTATIDMIDLLYIVNILCVIIAQIGPLSFQAAIEHKPRQVRWGGLHAPVVTEWWPACLHKQSPTITVTCHQQPRPGAPPPDLRRLQRVPRHEKLWNYVTWPAWENSNVFLFNWCLYSSEISDCKSP